MDQQAKYTRKDILDLSSNSIASHHSKINRNNGILPPIMSNEELKIRGELEMDIESDLEQEIKDGIYHLAIRLHRLYQHQKERINAKQVSESESSTKSHEENRIRTLSEVNINIKFGGGTKIEIKETKKEVPDQKSTIRPRTSRSDYTLQGIFANKKFDWAKSLRSSGSSGSIGINRRNEKFSQGKLLSNNHGLYADLNHDNARRNLTSTAAQRRGNAGPDNKVLKLEWRY